MNSRLVERFCSALLALAGMGVAACSSSETPRVGQQLEIAARPLTLPGITDACYDLSATNGLGDPIWTKPNVCANQYGDGEGAITYIGTCDASSVTAAATTVTLVLKSLYTGDPAVAVATTEYANPCPSSAPCQQTVTCIENADVPVTFNIAIMRDAEQGFFDIAVNFDDIFCSAKFDCTDDDLLFNPFLSPSRRDNTAVLGFACSAGEAESTFMHMTDVAITCDGGATVLTLNPADPDGPGNLGPVNASGDIVFEHATYLGGEFLGNSAGIEKCYWNMAIGIWAEKLAGHTNCVLSAQATASAQQLPGGLTPANTVWPVVTFTIPLALDANQELACGNNAMDAIGSGVKTVYSPLTGAHFDHYLQCGTVTPGDHPGEPPKAIDDNAHTPMDVSVIVPVLTNDSGSSIFVVASLLGNPANGSAVLNGNGTVTYTPDAGFVGLDTFTYTIQDSAGVQASATVRVIVGPNAVDDARTTSIGVPVPVTVLTNDGGYQISLVAASVGVLPNVAPANGTLSVSGNVVTYTPNAGYVGQDTFGYTIVDGALQTDSALVTITIVAGPVAVDDAAHTPLNTAVIVPVLANDSGASIVVVPNSVSDPANGGAVLNGDGTVTYTPDAGFAGLDTFTYTIEDVAGAQDSATVTVIVGPQAVDDFRTTGVNVPVNVGVLTNDSGYQIAVVVGSVGAVTAPQHGQISVVGNVVTYTPNPGYIGTDTFDYTIVDGALQNDSALVTITIAGPAPTITQCATLPGTVQLAQSGAGITVSYGPATSGFYLPAAASGATVDDCCADDCCQSLVP